MHHLSREEMDQVKRDLIEWLEDYYGLSLLHPLAHIARVYTKLEVPLDHIPDDWRHFIASLGEIQKMEKNLNDLKAALEMAASPSDLLELLLRYADDVKIRVLRIGHE